MILTHLNSADEFIFEMSYYLFITIYLHSELINLIIVPNENFRFGKNRVIFLCISE